MIIAHVLAHPIRVALIMNRYSLNPFKAEVRADPPVVLLLEIL
jgi:hypothetical protein